MVIQLKVTKFRKALIALAVFSSMAYSVSAASLPLTDLPSRPAEVTDNEKADIDSLIRVAREQQKNEEANAKSARENNREMLRKMPETRTDNEMISDTGAIADADVADGKQNKMAGDFYYVLVSASLSDKEIKDMMTDYDGRRDVSLVIRGVTDKAKLMDELTRWQQLVLDSGAEVTVNLDPVIFKDNAVTAVPTIIHEKDGEFVASVSGISNIDFLKGKTGKLGTAGPTKEVVERSLLDMIEEGVKNLDFEQMKKDALNNYWPRQRQEFEVFPTVKKRATHTIDPTVIIPQDIVTPEGVVVAKKGKVNPLDVIPFGQKLIVFDASVPWQRDFARHEYENTEPGINPILITTNVYGDGWDTFKDAAQHYGEKARLYMIQPGMSERFGIEAVPSIVTADRKVFIINEYPEANYANKVAK
ncbi:TrbC family F-type conjugative pilus assembly protein [Providencia rettgeri]|nr:conjugal transfer protein [Providencia rettgeri]